MQVLGSSQLQITPLTAACAVTFDLLSTLYCRYQLLESGKKVS